MTTENQVTETPTTPAQADPAVTTPPVEGGTPATPPANTDEPDPKDDAAKDDPQLLFQEEPEKKEGDEDGDGDDKKDDDEGDKEGLKFEDFTIDPELVVPDEVKSELMGIINNKELDEKGKTQALLDLHQKMMKDQANNFAEFRKNLRETSKNDPVIGGDKLEASVKAANNAVIKMAKDPKFGGSEETYKGFVERLTVLGLGDDPYVIRFLNNVNTLLDRTKDDTVDNDPSGGTEKKSVENILWGNMK